MSMYGYANALNDFTVSEVFGAISRLNADSDVLRKQIEETLTELTTWIMKLSMNPPIESMAELSNYRFKKQLCLMAVRKTDNAGQELLDNIVYSVPYTVFYPSRIGFLPVLNGKTQEESCRLKLKAAIHRFIVYHICCVIKRI